MTDSPADNLQDDTLHIVLPGPLILPLGNVYLSLGDTAESYHVALQALDNVALVDAPWDRDLYDTIDVAADDLDCTLPYDSILTACVAVLTIGSPRPVSRK